MEVDRKREIRTVYSEASEGKIKDKMTVTATVTATATATMVGG